MIQMTYAELDNQKFVNTLAKLISIPTKNMQVNKIKLIVKHLQKRLQEIHVDRKKIEDAYHEVVEDNGKKMQVVMKGKEAEYETAMGEFSKKKFEVPFTKISLNLLFEMAEWSAGDLLALEPIVSDVGLVAEEPECAPATAKA